MRGKFIPEVNSGEIKLPVTHTTVSTDYLSVTLYQSQGRENKSKKKNDFYLCSARDPGEVRSLFEWTVSPSQLGFMGVTVLQ